MRWWREITRRARGCPPAWRLGRELSRAGDRELRWHLVTCRRCADEHRGLAQLVGTLQESFPRPEEMTAASREKISARLLAHAPAPARGLRRPRGILAAAGLAAAAGAVMVIVWAHPRASRPARAPETRASIRAIAQARFARVQPPPDEIIHLDEGSIDLEVAPLPLHERFRVATNDAEVEVRGTSFEVSAAAGKLLAVHVFRGRVEVRSAGGALAVLGAGDEWLHAAPVVAPTAVRAADPDPAALHPGAATHHHPVAAPGTPSPGPSLAPPATVSAAPVARWAEAPGKPAGAAVAVSLPASSAFQRAWSLLRGGDARGAATRFAEAETLAKGLPLEEDAVYWRAVALARSGEASAARQLFSELHVRFPASPRAGEADAALGWLLLKAGEVDAAKRAFQRAAADPSARVRASALEGLRRAPR